MSGPSGVAARDNSQRLSSPPPPPQRPAAAAATPSRAQPMFTRDQFEAARTAPAARRQPDRAFDGHYVSPDGRTHRPGTPLDQAAPGQGPMTVYTNGIRTDVNGQARDLQAMQRPGERLVGVHNSTEGTFADLGQSVGDKLGLARNPAVDTLLQTLLGELRSGRGINL